MSNFRTQATKSHILWDIPLAFTDTDVHNPSMSQKGHFGEFRQIFLQEFSVHQMKSWSTIGTWGFSAGPQGTSPDNVNLHILRLL